MQNSISKKFNFLSLLKFALPSTIMMIFISLYTIVDGIFVSNYIGPYALSAVNIVYPVINIILAISIMFGSGGSAVVGKKIGQNRPQTAKENFSLIIITTVIIAIIISIIGLTFTREIATFLGATDTTLEYAVKYIRIIIFFNPAFMLQILFQVFYITAGKPKMGLFVTLCSGILNIIFDYIFIVVLNIGIEGAALATIIGHVLSATVGLTFFFNKKNNLHFVKPKFKARVIIKSFTNGISEMITNLSNAITTFLFNLTMLKYVGEIGVAAITIILYSKFLLNSMYMGYSLGVSPVLSYNNGSKDTMEIKKLFKICLIFIMSSSIVIFIAGNLISSNIIEIFTRKGTELYDLTLHGFSIFSINFLFSGFNIFASAYFTALSDGKTSGIISFTNTLLLTSTGIILLPMIFSLDGIWLSVPIAEFLTFILSMLFFRKYFSKTIKNIA